VCTLSVVKQEKTSVKVGENFQTQTYLSICHVTWLVQYHASVGSGDQLIENC
jgi:hypothetical protein